MAKATKPAKPAPKPKRSTRVKCACASCTCTVDINKGVRKNNLVYCGRACMTACTMEQCMCEHDHCQRGR